MIPQINPFSPAWLDEDYSKYSYQLGVEKEEEKIIKKVTTISFYKGKKCLQAVKALVSYLFFAVLSLLRCKCPSPLNQQVVSTETRKVKVVDCQERVSFQKADKDRTEDVFNSLQYLVASVCQDENETVTLANSCFKKFLEIIGSNEKDMSIRDPFCFVAYEVFENGYMRSVAIKNERGELLGSFENKAHFAFDEKDVLKKEMQNRPVYIPPIPGAFEYALHEALSLLKENSEGITPSLCREIVDDLLHHSNNKKIFISVDSLGEDGKRGIRLFTSMSTAQKPKEQEKRQISDHLFKECYAFAKNSPMYCVKLTTTP